MNMRRLLCAVVLCLSGTGQLWAGSASTTPIEGVSRPTSHGLYRVSVHPPPAIAINRYQTWGIYIEDAAGVALDRLALEISADMPAHGHGLLTAPQVRPGDAPGRYRVEGMRFHMPGYWEIRVRVGHADRQDTLMLPVELE